MAASVVFRHRNKILLQHFIRKIPWRGLNVPSKLTGFHIVMPEMPPDTPETNRLLCYQDFPVLVSPELSKSGPAKRAIEYDIKFEEFSESLKYNPDPTFESVFDPIEMLRVPMYYALYTNKQYALCTGAKLYMDSFLANLKHGSRVETMRWFNRNLYDAILKLKRRQDLTEEQERLVDLYLREFKTAGMHFTRSKQNKGLSHCRRACDIDNEQFRINLETAQRSYSRKIVDPKYMEGIPLEYLNLMVPEGTNPMAGPWNIYCTPSLYTAIMKHCSRKLLREDYYLAYHSRAGTSQKELRKSNIDAIHEIVQDRHKLSLCYNHANFVEMVLSTTMAGNVANVQNLLQEIKNKLKPIAAAHLETLKEFARTKYRDYELGNWDIDYYRNLHKKEVHGEGFGDVLEFFPYNEVEKNLFGLCKRLFGISFQENEKATGLWSTTVDARVYDVIEDDGSVAGQILIDPYARPFKYGVPYAEMGRDRSKAANTTPIVYISLHNYILENKGEGREEAFMTFNDLSEFMFHFGKALQYVLNKASYSELGGYRYMEADTKDIVGYVFTKLCSCPSFLQYLSCHVSSKDKLPTEMIEERLKGEKHMHALDVLYETFLSALDIEFHLEETKGLFIKTPESAPEQFERLFKEYLVMPLHEKDERYCSFHEIFIGDKASIYYANIWAQVLASDIFAHFEDTLHDEEKLTAVGKRFKETYLNLGASIHPSKVFRKFTGRDPSSDAFLAEFSENEL